MQLPLLAYRTLSRALPRPRPGVLRPNSTSASPRPSAEHTSYPLPKLSPVAAKGQLPPSFYLKAYLVGILLGGAMEALMSTTGFYDSLRIAEGKRMAREMEEMEKVVEEMKKEGKVA